MANQLSQIMQQIADLIKTHQDGDAVEELLRTMSDYGKKFPGTIRNVEKMRGVGTIWYAVLNAADLNVEGGHE